MILNQEIELFLKLKIKLFWKKINFKLIKKNKLKKEVKCIGQVNNWQIIKLLIYLEQIHR